MSSDLANIRSALAKPLADADLLPVAWDNAGFDPKGRPFLRFHFIQSDRVQRDLGVHGYDTRNGFIQVDIFEASGAGPAAALIWAGEIEALYPRGSYLGNDPVVTITRSVTEAPVLGDTYFHLPVTVYWRACTQPD